MSNVTTGFHLKFDTTGSITGDCFVLSVDWDGESADLTGSAILVTDAAGKETWGKQAEATSDGFHKTYPYPGFYMNGITVSTLGAGVLRINLSNEK